jgi:hypothetical protein
MIWQALQRKFAKHARHCQFLGNSAQVCKFWRGGAVVSANFPVPVSGNNVAPAR